ncbi:transcriptional regulator NarL [Yersinia frederiksenii]|nr:transcriptional regulator NarL [Yersinia frederiksenii]
MNNVLILVFDEHPLIRYAVKNLIVKRGWQFLDTGCQKKTLKLISTYKPNLIILDILMQGCLGLNYIKKSGRCLLRLKYWYSVPYFLHFLLRDVWR